MKIGTLRSFPDNPCRLQFSGMCIHTHWGHSFNKYATFPKN